MGAPFSVHCRSVLDRAGRPSGAAQAGAPDVVSSLMYPDLDFDLPDAPRTALPRDAAGWVTHIRDNDMPAFGATVASVRQVTDDDRASAQRLAQVILQDAAMTTKVLKLANSALYNPARQSISTISRAIVVLGFDTVAEMALGIRLVDTLLAGGVRERVVEGMAHSFHAAVQARGLAVQLGDARAEEIFIAALLGRVGEMAFWCFGGTAAVELDAALREPGVVAEEVQQRVLGFRLRQLTSGLVREWRLGALAQSVADGGTHGSRSEQLVVMSHRIAEAAEQGWETASSRATLAALSKMTGMEREDLALRLSSRAEEAASIAAGYGAAEAARRIPGKVSLPEDDMAAGDLLVRADPVLQLGILRELSQLIFSHGAINDVMHLALEGIYRSAGFERVLFALVNPARTQIVAKAGLGRGADALCQQFIFSLDFAVADSFREVLQHRRAICLAGDGQTSDARLRRIVGDAVCCLAPIVATGRAVGLFLGDRGGLDHADDESAHASLVHFAQQVSLALGQGAPAR